MNSQHRQGVLATGARAVVAARSDDGLVEALELPAHPFCIGVQWHPEFLLTPQDGLLMQAFIAACATRVSHFG